MLKLITTLFLLSLSQIASADMQSEIEHLLGYVKSTDCVYERNGKKHNGAEAHKHILRKYDYYEDDIESTEDFIKYSATKSNMSGKFYLIHCPNQPTLTSQAWLLQELSEYRQERIQQSRAE
ncbi:DUF5329 family protein [Aliikangiella marina]|uniref:DUF5329 family protein n=1 Tax=Aliikangiella marina TaxID=1712262 RepID=UPI001AED6253|nr:DUF5329 family protein [Aliikangiella marina]